MGSTPDPISTISGQSGAANYGFVDPSGVTSQLQNTLYGSSSPLQGGPLGTYNQNAGSILGQVAGLSGPLQQTLSQTAAYQGQNALNLAGQNFANQGALGSGAGAQAFGQAIANPFAQAQAQLQSGQLQAGSQGLNTLMGASTSGYGQALQAGSNLMEHASGLVAPTYMTNPAYTAQQQGKGAASSAGKGGLGSILQPVLGGIGTAAQGALGL